MLRIKACSFCGELPNVYQINGEDYVECVNPNCPIGIDNGGEAFKDEDWNRRPIEEELCKRLDQAKGVPEMLDDAKRENLVLRYAILNAATTLKKYLESVNQEKMIPNLKYMYIRLENILRNKTLTE